MIDVLLYAVVVVTLSYLIYRYHRYSAWEQTPAGRAFMLMKVCLLALSVYGLANVWFLTGAAEDAIRAVITLSITGALIYQTRVVVDSQGGFRRSNRRAAEVEEPHQPMT